mgnify:CR=1 FL=1
MTKFRHLIWTIAATAGLMFSASQSFAQKPDVGDQPGLIADDSVELDPQFRKTAVLYRTSEPPGTIIISTKDRHLFLVQGGGRALRYGIGVGRDGFQWQGLVNITKKAEWPDWTPPPEMINGFFALERMAAAECSSSSDGRVRRVVQAVTDGVAAVPGQGGEVPALPAVPEVHLNGCQGSHRPGAPRCRVRLVRVARRAWGGGRSRSA